MSKRDRISCCLFFIIASFIFLLIASRSSFVYVFNNWDDVNSYFSVGKGIFNGKVPYRDIFDQKGFYLYFIYGVAYLISHTTFLGVYLIEVFFGALDILGIYNIVRQFASRRSSLLVSPFAFASIVASRSFWWGGSAEELCLPFYIWGLYFLVDYFENDYPKRPIGKKRLLLAGIFAGIIANVKFTGLGFFFAWMMIGFFAIVISEDFAAGIRACAWFLLGMLVPFIPGIIYFGVNGALYDWYWGYVYVNVFVYNKLETEHLGLLGKIYQLLKILYWLIIDNWQYFVFIILGMFYVFFKRGQKLLARIYAPVLFLFMFLGIFIGGRELPYYSLPLSAFSSLGVVILAKVIDGLGKYETRGFGNVGLPSICLMISIIFIAINSMNVSFMGQSSEDYFLYRFRDEVLQTEDATLLNVGCLDAGLYTLCDIVPGCRWFQTQTLDIDEEGNNPYAEQERYVREGLVDYVLVRDTVPASIDDHYALIDSEVYGWGDYEFNYYLYQKVR